MWTISNIICLLYLLLLSAKDIKIHKVSVLMLIIAGAGCIGYQICARKMNIGLIIGGILVGVLFLIISKVTREGIGYGDSYGILILGMYLGIWEVLIVLSIAFFLLLFVAVSFFYRKRKSGKCALPFYPFLTCGYVGLLLMGGI